MRKKITVMVLITMLVLPAFLFSAGAKESAAGSQDVYNIVFTTASVPEEAHTKVLVEYVGPRLKELTGGRVTLEVHSSSSLFSQDDELPATIRGNATMCYTDGTWLATYMPSTSMFSAGYIFKDLDHMNRVLNGQIGEDLYEEIAKKVGVRPFGSYYIGSRSINLRSATPAMTPADLRGVKLRMPNSEAWLMLGKALGANPTPIAFSELYTALATGTVDGQDNPLTATEEGKFYEVTKSIALTNHQIGTVWPAINEKFWQSLGPELQGLVKQAFVEGIEYNNKLVIDKENSLVEYFRSKGLTVVTPDIDAFKKQVDDYYLQQTNFIKDWDMDLLATIKALSN